MDVACRGVSSVLQVGQEMRFGITWSPAYSIKVTGIDGERVTADVTVPAAQPVPSVNIVSVRVKFNSVELERSQVEAISASMCEQTGTALKIMESAGAVPAPMHKTQAAAGDTAVRNEGLDAMVKGGSESISVLLGREGGLANALGGLISMRAGKERTFKERAGYIVESSDAQSILLRVRGGEADGQRFRLDRKADLNIEFLFEKAGFFLFPFRIDGIDVDNSGRATVKASVDCARNVEMEVFMSERPSSPYPACPRK